MSNFAGKPTDFNELLLRLYRLSQELPIHYFQDVALSLVKQVLPFDSSMWGTVTYGPNVFDIHTIHLHEESPEVLVAYEQVKHQDSAVGSFVGVSHGVRSFHYESFSASPDKKDFQNYLHCFDHHNYFIAADSLLSKNFAHWISLNRADKNAHCTNDECLLLGQLAPHMMQALAMNRVMHLDRLEVVDKSLSRHGRAIADIRGMLHHVTPLFRGLAQTEWNDWNEFKLPSGLMSVLSMGHACYMGKTVVIRPFVEHGLLFLKARPRCRADSLSAREWTIAGLISNGQSHKEIAKALNRSPSTVRNQIQGIYEKLQVSSIALLIEAMRQAEG